MAELFLLTTPEEESMIFMMSNLMNFINFFNYMLFMAFSVVSYILCGIGLQTIAKRRGIPNPWLSWVPVANVWMFCRISDHYQHEVKGKTTHRGKTFLWTYIPACILLMIVVNVLVVMMVTTMGFTMIDGESAMQMLAVLMVILLLDLVALGLVIAAAVIQYIAAFDIYRSCKPDKAVMFLVLSIIFSYPMPFFIFACRNDDLGMPPKPEELPPAQI